STSPALRTESRCRHKFTNQATPDIIAIEEVAKLKSITDGERSMSNKEGDKIFHLPVHPAAAIFPMMDDAELNELAEDIRINGLNQPLVIQDGTLIDGRNRREACKRIEVVPATVELNGQDPVAYILSCNIRRRHMAKGQQAMAVAFLYPDPQKRGRGNKKS